MAIVEQDRLQEARTAYAREVCASAGIAPGSEIERALASLPRERFVGRPPWKIMGSRGKTRAFSDDPADLYQDVLVSLGGEPGLNNGQPSLHAMCLDTLKLQRGERVVQVGAGTGYYTAAIALLVSGTGAVDAYEIEPDLSERAKTNLAGLPQAQVHSRSGVVGPLPECDAVYVSAGAAEPMTMWVDALRPGGRLLFPLAGYDGSGEMLLITRASDNEFAARFLCQVQFVPCIGAQSEQAAEALSVAFRRGDSKRVRRLVRNDAPGDNCWLAGRGWWLG